MSHVLKSLCSNVHLVGKHRYVSKLNAASTWGLTEKSNKTLKYKNCF